MAANIQPSRLIHMNAVLRDVEGSIQHLRRVFDAEIAGKIRKPQYDAFLFAIGGVLFEAFVPAEYLLAARFGPHYVGVEYQTDMSVAMQAISDREIRIVRESHFQKDPFGNPGFAVHTDPADCFGVAFEFYNANLLDAEWPGLGCKLRPVNEWSHPLGHTGLVGYTHAVADIDAASAFLQQFLSATPVYEEQRPAIGGRAVGLRIADVTVELQTPVAEGALAAHLHRYGDGIRSTVFGVRNIDEARKYLADCHLPVAPGATDAMIALPAEANLGLMFEFVEHCGTG